MLNPFQIHPDLLIFVDFSSFEVDQTPESVSVMNDQTSLYLSTSAWHRCAPRFETSLIDITEVSFISSLLYLMTMDCLGWIHHLIITIVIKAL